MPESSVITSSLNYACATRRALRDIEREGLPDGTALYANFEDARGRCFECTLVLDAYAGEDRLPGATLAPPNVIQNLNPYADPRPVTAAGGFVVRERSGDLDILLIFRRGVWDVPKGKLDPGESIEACAKREVCEEVGIDEAAVMAPLGQTIHGYRDGRTYAVKTTYWYAMSTDAARFTPQAKEKIEKVEWVPISQVRERLGYETLRRHLDAVEGTLRNVAAGGIA